MLIPLLVSATIVIVVGIYNQDVVSLIGIFLSDYNLPRGTGH